MDFKNTTPKQIELQGDMKALLSIPVKQQIKLIAFLMSRIATYEAEYYGGDVEEHLRKMILDALEYCKKDISTEF